MKNSLWSKMGQAHASMRESRRQEHNKLASAPRSEANIYPGRKGPMSKALDKLGFYRKGFWLNEVPAPERRKDELRSWLTDAKNKTRLPVED